MRTLFSRLYKSNSFAVIVFTGLGMIFTLFIDLIIVYKFGSTLESDIIVIALTFPLFLDTVFRESSRFTLVPFLQKKKIELQEGFDHYIIKIINASLLFGLVLFILTMLFKLWIIQLIGIGLPDSVLEKTASGLQIAAFIILISPITNVLVVYFNFNGRFSLVASRNITRAIFALVVILFAWNSDEFFVYYIASYSFGLFIYLLILATTFLRKNRFYSLNFPSKEELKSISMNLSYPFYGFTIRQGSRIAEKSIASLLMPGSVTIYYLAFRIISSLQTIIGLSIATISIEKLSKQASNFKELFLTLKKSMERTIFLVIGVIILLIIILNIDFIYLELTKYKADFNFELFFRVLLFFLPGLFFLCLIPIVNAGLYALEKNRLIFINMLIVSISNVLLAYFLSAAYGITGLSIATVIAALLGFLMPIFSLNKIKNNQK